MEAGVDVVFQATLRDGPLFGHADFLLRVDGVPSKFGDWSYEVADTKLARTPKAKFLVQLAFYSRLLGIAQGAAPLHMRLVLGDQSQPVYRCADYRHYVDAALLRYQQHVDALAAGAAPPYPEPCAYCDLCAWRDLCQARRSADDHLSQVANISRVQWTKLQAHGVQTMAALAALPACASVPHIQPDTLERIRSQAQLQDRARRTGQREVVLLPADPESRRGFFRLPEPDDGDLFFDMEGNPLEDGGLEYLFGFWYRNEGHWAFQPFWGLDRDGERQAFEQCIDFIVERRRRQPATLPTCCPTAPISENGWPRGFARGRWSHLTCCVRSVGTVWAPFSCWRKTSRRQALTRSTPPSLTIPPSSGTCLRWWRPTSSRKPETLMMTSVFLWRARRRRTHFCGGKESGTSPAARPRPRTSSSCPSAWWEAERRTIRPQWTTNTCA